MCAANLFLIFVLFSLLPMLFLQQIFENYSTCEYLTDSDLPEAKDERLEIPNILWEVRGVGRNSQWGAVFSPCGDFGKTASKGCAPGAAVCVTNRNARKSILNAGRKFIYTLDDNINKPVLKSINGQACDEHENFTVVIEFECEASTKTTPTVVFKDECELRIKMMKPSCTPACTIREDGNLIDLRPLQNRESLSVHAPSVQKLFSLNLCKASPQCDPDVSACEILHDNNRAAIADVSSQRITYDRNTNYLVYKASYGIGERHKRKLEMHIKCKWNAEGIKNLNYIVPMKQGKTFKFESESSLACIKLPMNCALRDSITHNYFLYNLTSLSRETTGWRVGNTPPGTIMFLNVCGPLRSSSCDQHSQVCYRNERNQYINLGSIPLNFRVDGDTVKGTFIEGSACTANQNLTYNTEVEFSCSQREKGPVLQTISDCVYKIKWESPAACPRHMTTGENCVLTDATGIVNLRDIHKSIDRTLSITQASYMRYNLCGPLNQPCNNSNDASICYSKNGQERVVGLSSNTLTRDETMLILNLHGHKCDPETTSRTKITFHCNHNAPTDGIVRVTTVRDGCLFEMNIDTPLACTENSTSECKIYNDKSVYDLSPLVRNGSNYMIKDASSNTEYILNVCQSVLNNDGTLCPPFTGACVNNLQEPNIMYRYLSMGKVTERSKPVIENGEVVIRYDYGSYCSDAEWRSTTIRFQCSQYEESPKISKRDECSYEFVWRTPHACPKQLLSLQTRSTNTVCTYTHPQTEKLVDFSNIQKLLTIEVAKDDVYIFSICEDNYTHIHNTEDGPVNETITSKVELLSDKRGPYLKYQLKNSCSTKDHANKVYIHLICDPFLHNEHFNISGVKDCIFHVNLITSLACTSKETMIDIVQATKLQTAKEETEHKQIANEQTLNYTADIHKDFINNESADTQTIRSNIKSVPVYPPGADTQTISPVIKRVPVYLQENTNDRSITNQMPARVIQRVCSVKNHETNFELYLNSIESFNITSSTGDIYTVNMNQASSTCNGYICKNGPNVLSESDECPIIQFNRTHSMIKLIYGSYQTCKNGRYHAEVWLKCKSTNEVPKISMESECNVEIIYPSKDACLLLKSSEIDESSSAGIAIGSSIGLLVIAIASFGGYLVIRRRSPNMCSRYCYQTLPGDKEHTRVYMKDTKL